MGDGPVSASAPAARSWKLARPHCQRTQALVVSGFSDQEHGAALFLEFGWTAQAKGRGAWLGALKAVCPITAADGRDPAPAALAFTHTGLERLGLGADALASFPAPFREGMTQVDRARRLGDRRGDSWGGVVEGGYQWSGNAPLGKDDEVERIPTPHSVHALLILYAATEEAVEQRVQAVAAAIAPHEVNIVRRLPLSLRLEDGIGREHFGFADGISQPVPFQDGVVVYDDGSSVPRDEWHGIALGEILVGHPNAYKEIAPMPVVPRPEGHDAPTDDPLTISELGAPEGFLNFGLDGSYMVVRELRQDVAAFWASLDQGCARIRARDPQHSGHVTAQWLAERVIGRTVDGDLLCPGGALPRDPDGQLANGFGFVGRDPRGTGCPLGSHVRRANPRDSLAPTPAAGPDLLEAANNHRILRRARKFGETIADPRVDDKQDRGLLFICLQADITRQFEFVQQTWLLNQNFHTLFDETDPLVGPAGMMTIAEQPLRRRVAVDTFVRCAGGEYFFLPSLAAIAHLAAQ